MTNLNVYIAKLWVRSRRRQIQRRQLTQKDFLFLIGGEDMKKILFIIVVVFLFGGCQPKVHDACYKNYEFRNVMETTVGSSILFKECQTTVTHALNPQNILRQETSTSELLYGGIANEVIKITYREYHNDIARPAFSQELQYDMKQSKIIVFRNTKIEVISAANDKIIYKVIESPEPSEVNGRPLKWTVIKK